MPMDRMTRRDLLLGSAILTGGLIVAKTLPSLDGIAIAAENETATTVDPKLPTLAADWDDDFPAGRPPKRIAAIITEYRFNSHADVILGKILEGFRHDGGPKPNLQLVSLYVDQFCADDLSRDMSRKHRFPIVPDIREALTLGTGKLAVDGVVVIGEHGDYPNNERGQKLYPRRKWITAIAAEFERLGQVVPIFSDKHLGYSRDDVAALRALVQRQKIPLMAGSSIPLSFRSPDLQPPADGQIERLLGIGFSGIDIYGFHSLEALQCVAEQRRGGETGIAWAEALTGDKLWQAAEAGQWPIDLVDQPLQRMPHATLPAEGWKSAAKSVADKSFDSQPVLFRFGYRDGLIGHLLMLNPLAHGIGLSVQYQGEATARSCYFEERGRPFPHFVCLVRAIERFMHAGVSPTPVERTWLTTGLLDALTESLYSQGRRIETPDLAIAYQPRKEPHAPRALPKSVRESLAN